MTMIEVMGTSLRPETLQSMKSDLIEFLRDMVRDVSEEGVRIGIKSVLDQLDGIDEVLVELGVSK